MYRACLYSLCTTVQGLCTGVLLIVRNDLCMIFFKAPNAISIKNMNNLLRMFVELLRILIIWSITTLKNDSSIAAPTTNLSLLICRNALMYNQIKLIPLFRFICVTLEEFIPTAFLVFLCIFICSLYEREESPLLLGKRYVLYHRLLSVKSGNVWFSWGYREKRYCPKAPTAHTISLECLKAEPY